jgi:mannose-6-phosphate isomerase-like protein (cupin superfamily)
MQIRRLVTGLDAESRAVVVSDGPPPRNHDLVHVPRMSSALLWATAPDEPLPVDGADPTPHLRSQLPLPGGTSFLIVTFPPDSVYADPAFDAAAAAAEQRLASPGITELFEPDNPGMHTTDTVDYTVVLAGEVWLELDDGQLSHLRAGDTVVQNGTRHAWRNLGTEPVTLAVVQVGANRHGRLPPRSRSGSPSRHPMIFAGSSQGPLPPQDEITLKFWPPITGQIFSAGTTGGPPRRGERQAERRP